MNDEIKMPLPNGKYSYYISNMNANELCDVLKKEVSFGVLMEVIYQLNSELTQVIWRKQNDR